MKLFILSSFLVLALVNLDLASAQPVKTPEAEFFFKFGHEFLQQYGPKLKGKLFIILKFLILYSLFPLNTEFLGEKIGEFISQNQFGQPAAAAVAAPEPDSSGAPLNRMKLSRCAMESSALEHN